LEVAVVREVQRPGCERVRLYGAGSDSDLGPSPLRWLAYRLAGLGCEIDLVFDAAGLKVMSDDDRQLLAGLATAPGLTVMQTKALPRAGEGWVLAEVQRKNNSVCWGLAEGATLHCDSEWSRGRPLIRGEVSGKPVPALVQIGVAELQSISLESGDCEIELQHELDGRVQGFGERMWRLLRDRHSGTRALLDDRDIQLTGVAYHDRYLVAPLPVALLLNLIRALQHYLDEDRWALSKVHIKTASDIRVGQGAARSRWVFDNWPDLGDRDQAVREAFDFMGIGAAVSSRRRIDTRHARLLELDWSNGTCLRLRLDQGFGYWRTRRGRESEFIFDADSVKQAKAVAELDVKLEGAWHPTLLFLSAHQRGR